MLLQSHTGVIQVFPAIPKTWKDVSFKQLRAMGGYLVSALMENGKMASLEVYSERGGRVKVVVPQETAGRDTIELDIPQKKWVKVNK